MRDDRNPTAAPVSPAHAVVAVVLQVRAGRLQVLLWQRARDPFAGAWSLPGGYLTRRESLEDTIRAHLATKVDVRELAHLEQLETLSRPDRHPTEWQLATAYLGLVPSDAEPAIPSDTSWHPVEFTAGHGVRSRTDHPVRPRAAAGQALVHEPRVRHRAGGIHAIRIARPVRGEPRPPGRGNESAARPRHGAGCWSRSTGRARRRRPGAGHRRSFDSAAGGSR